MGRSLKLIVVLAFASLALTACGKRGTLEPPAYESDGKSASVQPKPDEKPHRPFVLDGLLR